MDDWTMYQLTGEPSYIQRFRRKRALRAALMGGSLGAIGVLSTAMLTSQTAEAPTRRRQLGGPVDAWPPKWLPRRCAGVALAAGAISALVSWRASAELVGDLVLPSGIPEPSAPAAPAPGSGSAGVGIGAGAGAARPVATL
eukprot:TRINITY_DN64162_c0_g1_i1.p2 TRINITY_DN64162_c0_g1~~TRINITY_DN64162_c0_g1_i1.p2  ORF type:complete len:141 (-),score=34.78 TRINITY_DN64162_c0_g1_i1:52-474(-)